MVKLQIKIYKRQRERLRNEAHIQGVSIAEIIRRLIDTAFPEQEDKPAKTDEKSAI